MSAAEACGPRGGGEWRKGYAYAGEDIIASELLNDATGTCIDVGANHPTKANNTYLFYERGWTGVCIEPVPAAWQTLRAARPRDLHLNLAVSDRDGTLLIHEPIGAAALATLSPEVARALERDGYRVVTYAVPIRTLRSLAVEWGIRPPDLLSIDVEGHEKEVLAGTPFDMWRPRVIIVEATIPRTQIPSHAGWEPLLLRQGYRLHAIAGINRIYTVV